MWQPWKKQTGLIRPQIEPFSAPPQSWMTKDSVLNRTRLRCWDCFILLWMDQLTSMLPVSNRNWIFWVIWDSCAILLKILYLFHILHYYNAHDYPFYVRCLRQITSQSAVQNMDMNKKEQSPQCKSYKDDSMANCIVVPCMIRGLRMGFHRRGSPYNGMTEKITYNLWQARYCHEKPVNLQLKINVIYTVYYVLWCKA